MHNMLTKQREVHKYASEYLVRAAARMKEAADVHRRKSKPIETEFVKLRTGLKDSRDKSKLDPFWSGPYRVLKRPAWTTHSIACLRGST